MSPANPSTARVKARPKRSSTRTDPAPKKPVSSQTIVPTEEEIEQDFVRNLPKPMLHDSVAESFIELCGAIKQALMRARSHARPAIDELAPAVPPETFLRAAWNYYQPEFERLKHFLLLDAQQANCLALLLPQMRELEIAFDAYQHWLCANIQDFARLASRSGCTDPVSRTDAAIDSCIQQIRSITGLFGDSSGHLPPLPKKQARIFGMLIGRVLSAKEIASLLDDGSTAECVRNCIARIRNSRRQVENLRNGRGYYRPDRPPLEW